ncbi:MAG TPA: hypothetical protein VGS19_27220 [Streptosporangiaceae bacterium]|nr:hypothetical protein [Streptosporangiaceae bacterium]
MSDKPLRPEDYEGWRFICTAHQWMSNKVACPCGSGTDRGAQKP